MSIKNIPIKSDYTIDVVSYNVQAHQHSPLTSKLLYSADFETSAVDQLPAGWTTQNANGAVVRNRILTDASSNKALVLKGVRIPINDVDDPPSIVSDGNSQNFRWVSPEQTFSEPIVVSFKAYQGRPGGNYGSNDTVEPNEHLWLQYKIGSGSWIDDGPTCEIGRHPLGQPTWDGNFIVRKTINSEVDAANPISLRWISRTNVNATTHNQDLWVIDDIQVFSAGPLLKRFTFIGPPNLRLQQTTAVKPDAAYKTFLGKQKV